MAEEAEAYLLTTSENQKLKSSRGYTGKGLALYSNQDTYEGDFLDGVRSGKGKYIY
jgi:radial spoke head protein 1